MIAVNGQEENSSSSKPGSVLSSSSSKPGSVLSKHVTERGLKGKLMTAQKRQSNQKTNLKQTEQRQVTSAQQVIMRRSMNTGTADYSCLSTQLLSYFTTDVHTTWPKVCGHPNVIPIWDCRISDYCWFQVFHQNLNMNGVEVWVEGLG